MTRMIAVPKTGPRTVPVPPMRAIRGGRRLRSTPSAMFGSMNPEFRAKSTPAAALGRIGVDDRPVAGHHLGRPFDELLAVIEHDDAVAHRHHHFHDVLDDHQGEREFAAEDAQGLDTLQSSAY